MKTAGTFFVALAAMFGADRSIAAEVYWNDNSGIQVFNPWGGAPRSLLYETFETRGIAVDGTHDRLLWSDVLPLGAPGPAGVIRQGDLHGPDFTTIASRLPQPAGVAVDPRHGKVYWTDLGDGAHPSAVYAANLDGSNAGPIIKGEWLADIAGIALDAVHDQLYFSYTNPLIDAVLTGGIARADLDGKNVQGVVGGLGKPIGVAVDPLGNGLYWTDAWLSSAGGAADHYGRIESSTLDGQSRHIILGGLETPYGIALDLEKRHVYWTDAGTGKIQRTSMSGILPYFEDVLTGLANPTALAIRQPDERLLGDANGDHQVDRADMAVLAQNIGRAGPSVGWTDGDFDGDRTVTLSDLSILNAHWTGAAPGATPVPEPPTALLIVVAVTLFSCRRLNAPPTAGEVAGATSTSIGNARSP